MTQKRQEMWESSIWEFHGNFPVLTVTLNLALGARVTAEHLCNELLVNLWPHFLLEKASFIVAKKGSVSMTRAAS